MKIKVYMHTINGHTDVLICSYSQIQEERRYSLTWRNKQGFKADQTKYSHVCFYIGEETHI